MSSRAARRYVGLLALLALAACGSSGKSTGGPTTIVTAPGAVTIQSFVVPVAVRCTSGRTATVRISYSIQGARSQQILVDGRIARGTDASRATISAPIACDARKHAVTIVAYDVRGHRVSRVKYVSTESLPAAG